MLKIALIEDKPEEMERAQRAVVEASIAIHTDIEWEAFHMDMVPLESVFDRLEEMRDTGALSGVITDLHFYPRVGRDSGLDLDTVKKLRQDPPPAGLAVVIWCAARGIPVAVCTDSYHHGADVTWFNDVGLRSRDLFSLTDDCDHEGKRWISAVSSLLGLIKRREKK